MNTRFSQAALLRRGARAALVLAALAGCSAGPPAPIEHRSPGARAAARAVPPALPPVSAPVEPVAGPGMGEGAVQTTPVRPAAPLEGRPLESRPSDVRSSDGRPADARSPDSRPSAGSAPSALLKNQPRGTKLPYSSAALARLAQNETQSAGREAPAATPAAKPADGDTPGGSERTAPGNGPSATANGGALSTGWTWPARGEVLQSFEQGRSKGIAIGGKAGDPVTAAADGRVIFSGVVRGYGNLVIVKHPGEVLSVYAHNRSLAVKEGESVRRGQRIAEIGNSDTDRVKLHFEIRRQGKPVDPLTLLPAR